MERREPRAAALADVRQSVKREWERARRAELSAKSYRSLLQRYTVIVERPLLAGNVGDDRSQRQD